MFAFICFAYSTFKLGLQDELLVEPFAITWFHGITDLGCVGANSLPHVVQSIGHGIDCIYHKHDLRLLLKSSIS